MKIVYYHLDTVNEMSNIDIRKWQVENINVEKEKITMQRRGMESCHSIIVFVVAKHTCRTPGRVSTQVSLMPTFWVT